MFLLNYSFRYRWDIFTLSSQSGSQSYYPMWKLNSQNKLSNNMIKAQNYSYQLNMEQSHKKKRMMNGFILKFL